MLVNTSYTQFIIVLRALFLVGMLVTFVIFVGKYNIAHRPSFEAKGVLGLSVFGILFNDPFYLVEVYYPNLPLLFVSTSLVAAFFVALLLSWICMLQKIEASSQNRTFFLSVSTMWSYSGIAGTYFCLLLYFLF